MSEVRTPMQAFKVDMLCDQCGKGEMHVGSVTLPVNPPIYPHECGNCGHVRNYRKQYPHIIHEPAPIDGDALRKAVGL